MRKTKVFCNSRGLEDARSFTRRKFTQKISKRDVNVRLVECCPIPAKIAQSAYHPLGEALKKAHRLRICERPLRFKPLRIGEVMQRNKWPYAALMQRLEHLAVPCQSRIVPLALSWLDTAPLYREPQRIHAQRFRQIKIFFRIAPPVARKAGAIF